MHIDYAEDDDQRQVFVPTNNVTSPKDVVDGYATDWNWYLDDLLVIPEPIHPSIAEARAGQSCRREMREVG